MGTEEGVWGEAGTGFFAKSKQRMLGFLESKYFWLSACLLLMIVSFVLGRLSYLTSNKTPVRLIVPKGQGGQFVTAQSQGLDIKNNNEMAATAVSGEGSVPLNTAPDKKEEVVASKNGTKYHYPWCAGAKQISEKNKITFSSIEEAKKAGYTPASNCKGLK